MGTVPAWPAKPVTGRPHRAIDGGDGSQGSALLLKYRALLDMQFEEGSDLAFLADTAAVSPRVPAGRDQGLAHRNAVTIAHVQQLGLDRADQG
jgi:hypothetical protein